MTKHILFGLAMLAVTSAFGDDKQAGWIKILRDGGPTADFSQLATESDDVYSRDLTSLAEADAIVYFQDHKALKQEDGLYIGLAHAFKHLLIGNGASYYGTSFRIALDALLTKE